MCTTLLQSQCLVGDGVCAEQLHCLTVSLAERYGGRPRAMVVSPDTEPTVSLCGRCAVVSARGERRGGSLGDIPGHSHLPLLGGRTAAADQRR